MPADPTHGPSPVILITGASSGIGEATARLLAREPGAAIVLVARRQERLAPLAEELPAPASFVAVDLLDDDAPRKVREHLEARHGRLDLLVNNAGAAWRARFCRGRLRERAADDGDQLRRATAAHRGAAAAPAQQCPVGDRERRLDRRAGGARRYRRLQRIQVRARGVVGLPHRGGARARRPRRARAAGFHRHRGLSRSRSWSRTRSPAVWSRHRSARPKRSAKRVSAGAPSATSRARTGWRRRFASSPPRSCAARSAGAARRMMTTTTGGDLAEREQETGTPPAPPVPSAPEAPPFDSLPGGRSPLPPPDRHPPEEPG